ncbi:hypothetical protein [Cryobacterium sp. Y11]|uniref:hypothetical protein n=1 Tax=Cryobacterium sp. Y11 TaxID=2045016 RepID=UPI001304A115|nr:hypothetical protein [Cryobacterium sp. Y11]
MTVERDAARTDAGPESARSDQRVADLRLTEQQHLTRPRSELAETRQNAREQHT